MSRAIPVFVAIFLCLLAAGLVGRHLLAAPRPRNRLSRLDWQVWRTTAWLHLHMYAWRWTAQRWRQRLAAFHAETLAEARARHDSMLRARSRTARPDGPPPIPAPGAARTRPHGVPIADTGAMHAARDELLAARPVNGVNRGTQPRKTIHVIICDPAVTPVVPRYYRAWLEGRFLP